jgi:hypothetical protein
LDTTSHNVQFLGVGLMAGAVFAEIRIRETLCGTFGEGD